MSKKGEDGGDADGCRWVGCDPFEPLYVEFAFAINKFGCDELSFRVHANLGAWSHLLDVIEKLVTSSEVGPGSLKTRHDAGCSQGDDSREHGQSEEA